ncbi:MAG: hypothetical protein ACRC37_04915, partial [Lentisphaeria bacterium]
DKVKIVDLNAGNYVTITNGSFPIVTAGGNRVYYLEENGNDYLLKSLSKINGIWQVDTSVSLSTDSFNKHQASQNGRFLFFENSNKFCYDLYEDKLVQLEETFQAINVFSGVELHKFDDAVKIIAAKNKQLLAEYPMADFNNVNAAVFKDSSNLVLTENGNVLLINRLVTKSLPVGFVKQPEAIEDELLNFSLVVDDELDQDMEFLGIGQNTSHGVLNKIQNFEFTYQGDENFNTDYGPSEGFSILVRDSFGQKLELLAKVNVEEVPDNPEILFDGLLTGNVALSPNSSIQMGFNENNNPFEKPDKEISIVSVEALEAGDETFVEYNLELGALVKKETDFTVLGYEDLVIKYEVDGSLINQSIRIEHSYDVNLVSGWNAIGVPFIFSERSLQELHEDHMGIFMWDVESENYVEVSEESAFNQGEAIWLFKMDDSNALLAPNVKAPAKNSFHDSEFFKVRLTKNKWNFFSPIGYGDEAVISKKCEALWEWNPFSLSYFKIIDRAMTPMKGYWNYGKTGFDTDNEDNVKIKFENF